MQAEVGARRGGSPLHTMAAGLRTSSDPRWNRFLGLVSRSLRSSRNPVGSEAAGWFVERTTFASRPYFLPLAWFVTRGCSMDHAGSCTMCNFGAGTIREDSELVQQIGELLGRMGPLPMIYITPLGSMFDDAEVPPRARDEILKKVAATGCVVYGTESRPETITDERMARFREIFGPRVELQIGVGLESSSAFVRRNCTNKGLLEEDYLRAISIMKKYDIKAMVHVLLKPAFLTEREAIEDAVATCNWAWEHGADRIIFLMTNLKPHTLVNWLAERGHYRVPYLWSGVEVLSRVGAAPDKPITLSGVYAGTPILKRAHNCEHCSTPYLEGIQRFSMTLDPGIIAELREYPCACREEWGRTLLAPAVPLRERLTQEYEFIGRGMFGADWWQQNRNFALADLA